jgi:N-methylhydantoinase A
VVATSPVHHARLAATGTGADAGAPEGEQSRPVFSGGEWVDAWIFRGEQLREGMSFDGLAVVEMRDTTVVVGARQRATVDGFGNLIIESRR